MQDRFLFRGKTLGSPNYPNGKFIYGYLYNIGERPYIYTFNSQSYEVKPETVGQCIGLKDKNGRLIYEGDIVRVDEDIAKIRWSDLSSRWVIESEDDIFDFDNTYGEDCVVIGNIHENPDLLGDKTDE